MISTRLLLAIKKFEGFRPLPYLDVGGIKTWGYGETGGEAPTTPLSESEATLMLQADLCQREAQVDYLVKVPITSGQRDALISFVYNLGPQALERSTLLKLLNEKQYAAAGDELKRWIMVDNKIVQGLVNRRNIEFSWWNEKETA